MRFWAWWRRRLRSQYSLSILSMRFPDCLFGGESMSVLNSFNSLYEIPTYEFSYLFIALHLSILSMRFLKQIWCLAQDGLSFNSLYEIRITIITAIIIAIVLFQFSLWDSLEKEWLERARYPFNSLYEILEREMMTKTEVFNTFNSLYEILISYVTNIGPMSYKVFFQFSLWDSMKH